LKILVKKLKTQALKTGFDSVGITNAFQLKQADLDLQKFIAENRHGTMAWLAETAKQRPKPCSFFPQAKSILIVALNYFPKDIHYIMPKDYSTISIYARGRDYHKVLRKKLKSIFEWLKQQEPKTEGKIFVDSFPIMEKPLAVKAGIGWIGKNSTLLIKNKGSFFFLGGIILNLPLPADPPFKEDFCGNCNRCQTACPTGAITAPYQLDANKCISYLTIEHKGEINPIYHKQIANYIFGCDICQMVCPWNQKYAKETHITDFSNRFTLDNLPISSLLKVSPEEYEKIFEGTPIKRAGINRFFRNIKIIMKNKVVHSINN
jgi:epoxyqueuosine reductase